MCACTCFSVYFLSSLSACFATAELITLMTNCSIARKGLSCHSHDSHSDDHFTKSHLNLTISVI